MMLKSLLVLFLAPIAALAASHNVDVGANKKLAFKPSSLVAAPGDKVHFHYYPGDHGVAEGSYSSPCTPKKNGFWSGFIDSQAGPASKMFTITIKNTKPIFIYCPNADLHCQVGMSMVINPGGGKTLKDYQSRSTVTKSKTPKKVRGGKISPNKGS